MNLATSDSLDERLEVPDFRLEELRLRSRIGSRSRRYLRGSLRRLSCRRSSACRLRGIQLGGSLSIGSLAFFLADLLTLLLGLYFFGLLVIADADLD